MIQANAGRDKHSVKNWVVLDFHTFLRVFFVLHKRELNYFGVLEGQDLRAFLIFFSSQLYRYLSEKLNYVYSR